MKIKYILNKSVAELWTIQILSIFFIRACAFEFIRRYFYIPSFTVTAYVTVSLICLIVPKVANSDISLRKSLGLKFVKSK